MGGHKIPSAALTGGAIEFNVYPATKYAVTAITETLRLEISALKLKTKVTVKLIAIINNEILVFIYQSLSPGLVKTEIFKANDVDKEGAFFMGPHLQPKHISDAVIYVLSTPPVVNISELTIQPVGEEF